MSSWHDLSWCVVSLLLWPSTLHAIERMRSHAFSIFLIFSIFSSSRVNCASRSRDSLHERRDDLSDDIFTNQNGNEDLGFILNKDDVGLPTDQDLLFQDRSSSEDLNNLELIVANPREEIFQSSSCEQVLNKRDDLISSRHQLFFLAMVQQNLPKTKQISSFRRDL